ncbi:hypothetical protein K469DRAFT_463828, partial [Zopfia rhizophila CBS 207.26]
TPVSSLASREGLAAFTLAIDTRSIKESFDLMSLPLSIRKEIYTPLLTIPALICVRQKKTPYQHFPNPYSNANDLKLEPGIAFVLTQTTLGGMKSSFGRFPNTNIGILRASKMVYEEAKEVLYGSNTFDLRNHTNETSPPADFAIPLFSPTVSPMIRHLCIRAEAIYPLRWMILSGHRSLGKAYPSIQCLTVILELESLKRGFGKVWVRKNREGWVRYVKRIHTALQIEIYECEGVTKSVPVWMNLKVLFDGERYVEGLKLESRTISYESKMVELKRGVAEAWELFKKG